MPPSKQSFIVGGKWTATAPSAHRHFEIVSVTNDAFELRCVVSDHRQTVNRTDLRDRQRWLPGWRAVTPR